ncbi:hypothetical protein YerA41_054 [Yersinia phage YerA41]|nr:hypothetical protein YerA41_054 [Yersinia phage YerA41]
MKTYAGIGSRETPDNIQEIMTTVASALEKMGFILRSGGADGADLAFEKGVVDPSMKEIYIPFKGFNKSSSDLILDTFDNAQDAYATVDEFHPNPFAVKRWKKSYQLMARNSYQVLGRDHKSPSNFIICWTVGGKIAGGTGQALRMAKKYNIRVINLGSETGIADLKQLFIDIENGMYND